MLKLCQMGRCKAMARLQAQPAKRYPDGGKLFCLFRPQYCRRDREVQFPTASPVSGACRFRAAGFRYHEDFLSPAEETTLSRWIETLPLRPFEFRGSGQDRERSGAEVSTAMSIARPVILLASVLPV
jgi:hypothetical protein